MLNLFLRSLRRLDPARKEGRIRAARERIEDLEGRSEAAFAILNRLNRPGEESHGAVASLLLQEKIDCQPHI